MEQILGIIFGVVVVLLVILLIAASTRPSSFRVQRSAKIKAPPERIYSILSDFHRWSSWSPWEKMDPAMTRTHSGAESGKGAAYAWKGNKKVGEGRMEITEVSPPLKITIKLDFLKPFEAHNTAEFTLEPQGDATQITWAMTGPQAFMMKVMSLFMNMDQMIGKDFEAGLANLKTIAESQA
jgi:uncharacterized protein YndB with AHSA1/START domain